MRARSQSWLIRTRHMLDDDTVGFFLFLASFLEQIIDSMILSMHHYYYYFSNFFLILGVPYGEVRFHNGD